MDGTILFNDLPELLQNKIRSTGPDDIVNFVDSGILLSITKGMALYNGRLVVMPEETDNRVLKEIKFSDLPDWAQMKILENTSDVMQASKKGNTLIVQGSTAVYNGMIVVA